MYRRLRMRRRDLYYRCEKQMLELYSLVSLLVHLLEFDVYGKTSKLHLKQFYTFKIPFNCVTCFLNHHQTQLYYIIIASN